MSCSKHLLGLNWKQHDWRRHVTHAESLSVPLTDMWGRRIHAEHIVCHTQYVCEECGKVRDEGECTCEPDRGNCCVIRLEYLTHADAVNSR